MTVTPEWLVDRRRTGAFALLKLVALFATVLGLASLAACGSGGGNADAPSSVAPPPPPPPAPPPPAPAPGVNKSAGDRLSATATGAQFPSGAFVHSNGGNPQSVLIDVTRLRDSLRLLGYAKWNTVRDATPNDPRDDDALAISDALNFLLDTLVATSNATSDWQPKHPYVLYLPAGVYHVASQIAYRDFDFAELTDPAVRQQLARAADRRDDWDSRRPYEKWSSMRIVGQIRGVGASAGTEIRLADNAVGFGNVAQPRAVLSFTQNAGLNNAPAGHRLENLRVDTGSGNPGAIGVDWFGANNTRMQNVSIQGGASGSLTGLRIPSGPTLGLLSDLSIDGFETGVQIDPFIATDPTLEHVSIGPNVTTGIEVNLSTPILRGVLSRTRGSALKLTGASSHVVMIDSDLHQQGGSGADAAIQNTAQPLGAVFARNINITGFANAYRSPSLAVASMGRLEEFVSKFADGDEPSVSFTAQAGPTAKSLNLPIRDVPLRPAVLPAEWIRVEAYRNGTASDGAAVASAFAAAAATPKAKVLFERAAYRFDTPIPVPASVQMIYLSGAEISVAATIPGSRESKSAFVVTESSSDALHIVEGVGTGSPLVLYGSTRDLVIDSCFGPYVASAASMVPGATTLGDVFLVSVNNYGRSLLAETEPDAAQKGQRIFARAINTEFKGGVNFRVNSGGTLWVLGYKVEGSSRNFRVETGGTLEVLGGVMNEPFLTDLADPDLGPGVDNDGGNISLVFNTSSHKSGDNGAVGHDVVIRDANLPADRANLGRSMFPRREPIPSRATLVVPLYRSTAAN